MNEKESRVRLFSQSSTSSSDSSCIETPLCLDNTAFEPRIVLDEAERKALRCYRKLAIIALVVSVVTAAVLVACVGLVAYGLSYDPRLTGAFNNQEVCMPCIEISPDPLGESTLLLAEVLETHKVEDNEMCCARTPAQYAALFKLILQRQEAVKKLADILGSSGEKSAASNGRDVEPLPDETPARTDVVSAHLIANTKVPVPPETTEAVQAWRSPGKYPTSHMRGGLAFHDNRLYVQQEGLYFVYCQILYSQDRDDHHRYPPLSSSYVKRRSVLYPSSSGILLKARHTRSDTQEKHDRHSSFVAGLFFLHAGDELFVHVANPRIVAHDDEASFFGLFRDVGYAGVRSRFIISKDPITHLK